MDDSNGEFEFIEKSNSMPSSAAKKTATSALTNVSPPSELPSFIVSPLPPISSPGSFPPPPLTMSAPSKETTTDAILSKPPGVPLVKPGSSLPQGTIPSLPIPAPSTLSQSSGPPVISSVPMGALQGAIPPPPISMSAPIQSILPSSSSIPMAVPPLVSSSQSTAQPSSIPMGVPPAASSIAMMPSIPMGVPPTMTSSPPIGSGPPFVPPVSNVITSLSAPVTNQPSNSLQYSSFGVDPYGAQVASQNSPNSDGWLGWIKGTVQTVGNRVAEKAKTSMDTMITTLDPQMKDFIHSGGDIDIIIASDKEVKISPIREAFQRAFGKATVKGISSQCSDVAAQPVGFEAALKSGEGRINYLRASGLIHPQQPVIAVEGFIVELVPQEWFELGLLLLDDPWHDVVLQTYTQVTPVPTSLIDSVKSSTTDDYPYKETGFLKTIGQAASEFLNVPPTRWQESLTTVSRRDTIYLAARSLAGLYKSCLPQDVI